MAESVNRQWPSNGDAAMALGPVASGITIIGPSATNKQIDRSTSPPTTIEETRSLFMIDSFARTIDLSPRQSRNASLRARKGAVLTSGLRAVLAALA